MTIIPASDSQLFGPSSLIGRFLGWWLGELRACIPRQLLSRRRKRYNELAMVLQTDGPVLLEIDKAGKVRSRVALDAGNSNIHRLTKRYSNTKNRTARAGLRLPIDTCFTRTFALSREAEADAKQIAALELERKTPFKSSEIYWDCHVEEATSEDKLAVRQFVVKRAHLEDAASRLKQLGVPLSFIDVFETDPASPLNLNLLSSQQPAAKSGKGKLLLKYATFACCATLASAIYLGIDKKERALEELNAKVETTRKIALAVRKKLDTSTGANRTVIAMRKKKIETVPLIRIWNEITRVAPDTAYIEELRAAPDKIAIGGLASSAAGMIKAIEASPLFSGARFASQTITDSRSNKERFNITFKLERQARVASATQEGPVRQ